MSEEQTPGTSEPTTLEERLTKVEKDIEDIFESLHGLLDVLRRTSELKWPTCPPTCLNSRHEKRETY